MPYLSHTNYYFKSIPIVNLISQRIKDGFKETSAQVGREKLYMVIFKTFQKLIEEGTLPERLEIPSTRRLATLLNVSRSSVVKAFEILKIEKFVESKPGSGIRVASRDETDTPIYDDANFNYPALSEKGKSFLENIELINSTNSDSIAFRPGLPPLDIFPVAHWKKLSNLYWSKIKLSGLTYSPSMGVEELRNNIAKYLKISRGLSCTYDQLIIVAGSLQSLYLLGGVLIDRGDTVVLENPTFPNVKSIFRGLNAKILPVGLDDNGLDLTQIKDKNVKPKLIHVTPSSHYPSSVEMSLNRRKDLVKLASEWGSIIVENDYEHEINNEYSKTPTLFSLDKEQRTVYVGTFNRLLHPSLRIGYMVVPRHLKDPLEALLMHSHRFVSPVTQFVLNEFIASKYLYTHIDNLVKEVKSRKKIFTKRFEQNFGPSLRIEQSSVNSLHILLKLKNGISDKKVVDLLARYQILAHSYSKCFHGKNKQQGLIMGYSSVPKPVIHLKLDKMKHVLKDLL
jgi:GntR family transcriptional regulator/MocR family aminotransferase